MALDYNQIADSLERMAVQQQAMTDAALQFRSLGSIDGATKEAISRRDAAVKERLKAEEELDAVIDKVADAKLAAQSIVESAQVQRDKWASERVSDAKALFESASADAEKIISDAKVEAEKIAIKTLSDLYAKRDELTRVSADVISLTGKRDALIADTDKAQARYDAVQEQIKKLAAA